MGHNSGVGGVDLELNMSSAGTSKLASLFQQRSCQMLRKELGPYVGALASPLCAMRKATVSTEPQDRESHPSVSAPGKVISRVVYLGGDVRGTDQGTNRQEGERINKAALRGRNLCGRPQPPTRDPRVHCAHPSDLLPLGSNSNSTE